MYRYVTCNCSTLFNPLYRVYSLTCILTPYVHLFVFFTYLPVHSSYMSVLVFSCVSMCIKVVKYTVFFFLDYYKQREVKNNCVKLSATGSRGKTSRITESFSQSNSTAVLFLLGQSQRRCLNRCPSSNHHPLGSLASRWTGS